MLYAAIFSAAMALNFIFNDRNFRSHFQAHFDLGGRLILVGAC